MRTADAIAVTIPPLLLRLLLAVTFTWAGLGKLLGDITVSDADAAILDTMQVTPVERTATRDDGSTVTTRHTTRVYALAITVHRAATPAGIVAADGSITTPTPIWPDWAASGSMPVFLAYAAAITELVAGLFLLIGFLTRFAGLAVAGTMLAAAWLTQVGPAIQSGATYLGFLPRINPWWDELGWMPLGWQLALATMGLALLFAGGGALSIDRAVSHRGHHDDDDDDDHDDA